MVGERHSNNCFGVQEAFIAVGSFLEFSSSSLFRSQPNINTSASINIKYSRDTTPRSRRRCRAGLVSFGAEHSWGLWPTDQGCWCCATVRVGRRTTAFAAGVGAEGLAGIGEQTGMALERTARTIKSVKI